MPWPLGAVLLCCAGWACASENTGSGSPPPAATGSGFVARAWDRALDTQAWSGPGIWRFNVSPFSHHFRYSEEHRYVWAVGIERQNRDDWLAGASYFSNSFGQPSAYVYIGRRFNELFDQPNLFGQVSAGVMYGYVGKYQHKVPLNYGGFSPGALVSMGWQFEKRSSAVIHLLGDAGFMLQLSHDFR